MKETDFTSMVLSSCSLNITSTVSIPHAPTEKELKTTLNDLVHDAVMAKANSDHTFPGAFPGEVDLVAASSEAYKKAGLSNDEAMEAANTVCAMVNENLRSGTFSIKPGTVNLLPTDEPSQDCSVFKAEAEADLPLGNILKYAYNKIISREREQKYYDVYIEDDHAGHTGYSVFVSAYNENDAIKNVRESGVCYDDIDIDENLKNVTEITREEYEAAVDPSPKAQEESDPEL